MNKKVFLDTSFVIALINDKDQYHELAQQLAAVYLQRYLITTDAVLLEIGNSLSKNFKTVAVESIKTLRESAKTEVVEVNTALFEKGLAEYEKYNDKTWGLVDCISFVVMRENNVTDVLTSDKHFVQAGFRALMLDLEN